MAAPARGSGRGAGGRGRGARRRASDTEKVNKLMEMGFGEAAVRGALQASGGDADAALETLLGGA